MIQLGGSGIGSFMGLTCVPASEVLSGTGRIASDMIHSGLASLL
jgi:hypothetical protein